MTEPPKDNIYIDVDEEITGLIDKVSSSNKKIVALVLPKRATVLQSIVNMKLLKRAAERNKKSLVLITSEAGLLPLAGAVGLHVAKNLTSKPEIPDGPPKNDLPDSLVHEEEIEPTPTDPALDKAKSVGELAGVAAVAATADEEVDVPDELTPAASPAVAAATRASRKAAKAQKAADKSTKVPNFERFRKLIILGGVAFVGLIVFLYLAIWVWPSAKITIDANATTLNTTVSFTADTTAKTVNLATKTVPAESQQVKKTGSQSVASSGQKNVGSPASGTVNLTAQVCNSFSAPDNLPAGSTLASGGQAYFTQKSVSFTYSPPNTNNCLNFRASNVPITASTPGVASNTGSGSAFTVNNHPEMSGQGSATGGTDNVVKTIAQADINSAQTQLSTSNVDPNAKTELIAALKKDNMSPLEDSFTTTGPTFTNSSPVGTQADTVTVNATTVYSMVGVSQDGLNAVITANANGQIDTNKQEILNNGLSSATFTIQNPTSPQVAVTMQTGVMVGSKLDLGQIKTQVAGKKKAETVSTIEAYPGIKNVTVNYSPFWVTKTPSKPNKVKIVFKQASS